MAKILVVDDEDYILHSLERTFIMTDHQLETAISGAAALAMLREAKYDVLISDMRMPVMNGQQFLAQARRLYPDSIRFILSGYADRDIVLEAARLGDAKAFLLKPWQNEEMIKLVEEALEMRARHQAEGLQYSLAAYYDLPVTKYVRDELVALLATDKTTSTITEAVAKHAGVVAALLRISWVAFSGNRPSGLYHALSLLGWENTMHILKNLPLRQADETDDLCDGLAEGVDMHSHSVQRELVRLLQFLKFSRQEIDCDYLGLVHDIGLACLAEFQPDQLSRIRTAAVAEGICLHEAEQKILGFDHALLGASMLEWWGIPSYVCQAVRWHLQPGMAAQEGQKPAALLHLANYLAQQASAGEPTDSLDRVALEILGIDDLTWLALQEGRSDERK